jgi:hypothetical protein
VTRLLTACQPAAAPRTDAAAIATRVDRLLRETIFVDGHNDLVIHYHACRHGCPRALEGYDIGARLIFADGLR